MRIFDLHSHSNVSDGILSPEMLLSRAKAQGVDSLALTDHDSLSGLPAARRAAEAEGIELIDGIEFSSQWGKSGVHIVGLQVDTHNTELLEAVAAQLNVRDSRAETIAQRLEKAGIVGALAGAKAIAGDSVLGRPHFAQFLVQSGVVKDFNAAFKKYLGAGKPGDVKNVWPEMTTVVSWIRNAGGIAVLAHPNKYNMTRTKLRALVSDFSEAGGQAIEVISGKQNSGVADDLARIARDFDLYASCGSDFHAPDQPWQELGAFGSLPEDCRPVWELFKGVRC